MKKGKSILTRCLALVLALVLIVSSANLGAALKASANGDDAYTEVAYGKLMADAYELADWEEALLSSGLVDPHFGYAKAPTADDKVVTIADSKIIAKDHNDWIPVSADIMVDNKSVETVKIENNEGTYTYSGEEFSAAVKYEMHCNLKASTQQILLNTGVYLNEGLDNVAAVYAQDSNLFIVEQAMDVLMSIRNESPDGITSFTQEFRSAVEALNAEMGEGMLNLRELNAGYVGGTEFLKDNWAAYETWTESTYEKLAAINNDSLVQGGGIDTYLQAIDQIDGTDNATLWRTFKGAVKELVAALEPVANDAWNMKEIFYFEPGAELDALLKNVGEPSKVNIVEDLLVDTATVLATQNMQTLVISVELKVVADEVGSTELVSGGASKRAVRSIRQNATAEDIAAEIEKSGVEVQAQAAWGEAFVAEHFEATTVQSEANGNIVVTITYAPKNYTVSSDYQASQQLPYGYQLSLPIHETPAEFAYDYIVDGKSYMQGEVITIEGDTDITRTEGKAYNLTSVYAVIGDNYGNDVAKNILASGALKGDEAVYYRAPESVEDVNATLVERVLKVDASFASDYEGLSWVPYTYGNEADGYKEFAGNTVSGYTARQAQINYILKLTNVSASEAAAALELAKELKAEAAKQKAGMDFLLSYYDDIGSLNKGYLEALMSVIKNFDFTPGDGQNGYNNYEDAKNKELIAYFNGIIGSLVATDADYIDSKDNNLMLYTMLTEYKNGGLAYYYKNSAAIYKQVSELGGFLNELIADEEYQAALALLLENQGMPEYIEKISKIGKALTDTKENLVPTNEAIDTTKNLNALVNAVTAAGNVEISTAGTPYIVSGPMTVTDESAVVLIAKIYVDGNMVSEVTTADYDRWSKLDASMIAELSAKIDAEVNKLGQKLPYYTVVNSINSLVIGTEMADNLTVSVTCNAKEYTVKIDGEDDQIVTINDLQIDLPQHENHPSTVYEYTVKGKTTRETSVEFTAEDLDSLFVNGTYTITREIIEAGKQMLDAALAKLNANSAGNTYEIVDGVLVANIAGTGDGLMAFAKGLLDTGYGYIGINGKDMMYSVEGEGLEISVQALIDATLEDTNFGRDTVIALGKEGKGQVLTATLQLGVDSEVLYEEAMPFVLNLTSVPEQMATVAKGLEAGKNHFDFQSNGDHVYVYVNLPEKVYEVYLTAMVGIGELDKTNVNAINNAIALNFLYDYVMLIAESDVTAQTFENTLRIFDEAANEVLDKDIPDYDIAAYDKYLQIVKKALTSEGVVVEADETTMSLSVTGEGKYLLTLAKELGINLDAYNAQLGMIKEFKDGEVLSGKVIATLANTAVDFEALIVDVDAGIAGAKEIKNIDNRDEAIDEAIDLVKGLGLANGIDYTDNLADRASKLTGKAAIMLLDDASGNLTFNDTTIIDLNGKTFTGNIVANGHVYIMDSTLDTANAGWVKGSISGNVTIVAGNYTADVSAYLPDGYLQVNGNVQNALYTIESPNSGDLIVTVNTDVYKEECVDGYLPSVRALAADIAVDLVFNYYMAAKLSVDTYPIYDIDFDDLVGFVDSNTKAADLINQVLTMVDAEGISDFINAVSADLLDFAAIEEAIKNDTEIVSYDLTVAPYGVEIEHITDGDYLTVNLGSVASHSKTFNVALKLEGDNKAVLAKIVGELADIVIAENTYAMIDLEQPSYSDRTLWLSGSGKASLDLDLSKNSDYQTIIAVILAYGNPDKAEALVNAIGDQDELKEVFNDITVEEVFNALKALEREVGFAAMAQSLGVEVEVEGAAAKERVVHLTFAALGYILEKQEINGYPDKTMGMLEEGDSGRYTLTRDADVHGDITRRGFTVDASAVVEHVTLSVKIFGDDCLWGDVNHDGLVDSRDASLILQYEVNDGDLSKLDYTGYFCIPKADVSGDGIIDSRDASLVLQYEVEHISVFPAEL